MARYREIVAHVVRRAVKHSGCESNEVVNNKGNGNCARGSGYLRLTRFHIRLAKHSHTRLLKRQSRG